MMLENTLQFPSCFEYTGDYILERSTRLSIGYDLKCTGYERLGSNRLLLSTSIIFKRIQFGYYFTVNSKSGWATKGWSVTNSPGIIDPDYIDREIKVIFSRDEETAENTIQTPQIGDRIAQIVIHKVPDIMLSHGFGLEGAERVGGFGSTGLK